VAGGVAAGGGGAWAVSRWRGQAAGLAVQGCGAERRDQLASCGLVAVAPCLPAQHLDPGRHKQCSRSQLLRAGRGEQREAELHQQLLAGGGTGQPQACMSWCLLAARCSAWKGVYVNAFTQSAAAGRPREPQQP
jgi:hypothetical protein